MLSATQLEAINGHAPKITHDPFNALYIASCQCDCGKCPVEIRSGSYATMKRALETLREAVLAEHRLVAMQRANWACQRCGKVDYLTAHHRKFRSHGRDDRVQNLEILDPPCHDAAHGIHQGAKYEIADHS